MTGKSWVPSTVRAAAILAVSVSLVLADRTMVDIVVAENITTELRPRLDRLATDLRNEGYTARITSWPAGKSAEDVWNHLKDGYDNHNLHGALLVGHIPVPRGVENHDTDIPYWSMSSFDAMSPKHIWVSRFYAPPDGEYGGEVELIGNALDANHAYRTGAARFSNKAWTHSCGDRSPCKGHSRGITWANTIRDTWPVTEAVGADRLEYVLFEEGGDFLFETSHGGKFTYANHISIKTMGVKGCRIAAAVCNSCGSGALGGVVNFQNIGHNTMNVLSIGSTYSVGWAYEEIAEFGGKRTREQLKGGESWGKSLLYDFPFKYQQQTAIYGDLSLPAMLNAVDANLPLHTIKVIPRPGGSVSPLDSVLVRQGFDVSFAIAPAGLFFIRDVLVDGKSVGPVADFTFEDVGSNHTIEAVFASNSATIVSDDFESGQSGAGAGSWTGPWWKGVVVDGISHEGTSSLKIAAGSSGRRDFEVLECYTSPLTLSFRFRGDGFSAGEKLLIYVYSRGWHMLDELQGTDAEFRRCDYDVTPHLEPGAGNGCRIGMWFSPSDAQGVAYIDDIRLFGAGNSDGKEPPGMASLPGPEHGSRDVAGPFGLTWGAGSGAMSHTVYFGTDSTPDAGENQGTQTAVTFDPGPLQPATTYYWRIDEVNENGATKGQVWSFTTKDGAVGATRSAWNTSIPRISCLRGNILLCGGARIPEPTFLTLRVPSSWCFVVRRPAVIPRYAPSRFFR